MPRTEEEVLEDLLKANQGIPWSRVTTWIASGVTLAVVVALMLVTMRQIAQTDRDAFDAHLREARVQRALDAAREVQAISSEQFLGFSSASSFAQTPEFSDVVEDFLQGRFLSFPGVRQLRTVATDPASEGDDRLLATIILDINSIERWIAPLAESTREIVDDQLYQSVLRRIPDTGGAPWAVVRQRLDGVALQVGGANEGTCGVCTHLLWGDDLASLGEESRPSFVDPATSVDLAVWQAECLRKLPILIEPDFTDCALAAHGDSERQAARDKGRRVALERFGVAAEWIEAQSPGGEERICGVLGDDGQTAGRRTVSVTAGRAYNGLAMSLINRDAVTVEHLTEAEAAINRAICFREEAQETRSQVAASRENLAVIAYREAWQAKEHLPEATAAFGRARCLAEAAVQDNANLPWSWTILYLTNTARASVFERVKDCAEVLGKDEADVNHQSRSRAQLWRRLTFFEPDAFAPEELPGLLPMFPPGEFNRTGYEELGTMLLDVAEDHRAVRDGSEASWRVFVTSVTEAGRIRLPFLGN